MKTFAPLAQLLTRLALGLGFLLPVFDRLGFMGAPGSAQVAWGNYDCILWHRSTIQIPGICIYRGWTAFIYSSFVSVER